MEIRSLGASGLKVSAIGLGCNNFGMRLDEEGSRAVVHKALDLGINFFDVADFYGGATRGDGERFLGKALGGNRDNVVIATKFGVPMGADWALRGGGSRGYILQAAEESLRRLGTDHIDLYQLHLPDPSTPIEETLRALEDLIRQGKVRYIGHSNLAGWQVADAAWTARHHNLTPFVSSQSHYSVLTRDVEGEVLPACRAHGISLIAYLPLEGGVLTGKYEAPDKAPEDSRFGAWSKRPAGANIDWFLNERNIAMVAQLSAVAAESGAAMLDLALGWVLSRPIVGAVLVGASRPEQLESNLKAAKWRPTPDQMERIDAISPPPKAGMWSDVLPNDLRKRGWLGG